MSMLALIGLLIQAAPAIAQLGGDAWEAYKKIVAALKVKVGTPEEKAALDRVEVRMRELDVEVANAKLPD